MIPSLRIRTLLLVVVVNMVNRIISMVGRQVPYDFENTRVYATYLTENAWRYPILQVVMLVAILALIGVIGVSRRIESHSPLLGAFARLFAVSYLLVHTLFLATGALPLMLARSGGEAFEGYLASRHAFLHVGTILWQLQAMLAPVWSLPIGLAGLRGTFSRPVAYLTLLYSLIAFLPYVLRTVLNLDLPVLDVLFITEQYLQLAVLLGIGLEMAFRPEAHLPARQEAA